MKGTQLSVNGKPVRVFVDDPDGRCFMFFATISDCTAHASGPYQGPPGSGRDRAA